MVEEGVLKVYIDLIVFGLIGICSINVVICAAVGVCRLGEWVRLMLIKHAAMRIAWCEQSYCRTFGLFCLETSASLFFTRLMFWSGVFPCPLLLSQDRSSKKLLRMVWNFEFVCQAFLVQAPIL